MCFIALCWEIISKKNQHCFLARLRGELKMAPIRSFSVVKELVKSEEKIHMVTKKPRDLNIFIQ